MSFRSGSFFLLEILGSTGAFVIGLVGVSAMPSCVCSGNLHFLLHDGKDARVLSHDAWEFFSEHSYPAMKVDTQFVKSLSDMESEGYTEQKPDTPNMLRALLWASVRVIA